MTITTTTLPPKINTYFDPDLLMDYLQRMEKRVKNKIITLANKKIRVQDIGKKKEFIKLSIEFEEVYGRKNDEKEKFKKEIKEKIENMPNISNSSSTFRFKRMET